MLCINKIIFLCKKVLMMSDVTVTAFYCYAAQNINTMIKIQIMWKNGFAQM